MQVIKNTIFFVKTMAAFLMGLSGISSISWMAFLKVLIFRGFMSHVGKTTKM
jgi:hypothetical protein